MYIFFCFYQAVVLKKTPKINGICQNQKRKSSLLEYMQDKGAYKN